MLNRLNRAFDALCTRLVFIKQLQQPFRPPQTPPGKPAVTGGRVGGEIVTGEGVGGVTVTVTVELLEVRISPLKQIAWIRKVCLGCEIGFVAISSCLEAVEGEKADSGCTHGIVTAALAVLKAARMDRRVSFISESCCLTER